MLGMSGTGPLLGPWGSLWDLAWESPEAGLILLATAIGLVLAGIALTVYGDREARPEPSLLIVRSAPRRPRRVRRRR